MRAIQVPHHGAADVLTAVEVDEPVAGDGHVLVDVTAAGVNYIDTYHRSGQYPIEPPFVLGLEGAGRVRAIGSGVDGIAVGDRVAWKDAMGSYAEVVAVRAHEIVAVPDGVDDETAAAAMLQGLTAHYLATTTYPVAQGDWVIVHAAAGGVGQLLTQMVKIRGGHVLATTSTEDKGDLARAVGADEVVRYADVREASDRVTDGVGVAAVYDGVGKDTFDDSLSCLRKRGMMVLYGAASGPVPPVDLQRLNAGGSLFTTRPKLADYSSDPAELRARTEEMFGWIADGRLTVEIGHRYPLADAAQAHSDLQGRRTTAKVLLIL